MSVSRKPKRAVGLSRWFWSHSAVEATELADLLLGHDRFVHYLESWIDDPCTTRGQLEFEIQALLEDLTEKAKQDAEEERLPQTDEPWEGA
jgi:hypothetical protein